MNFEVYVIAGGQVIQVRNVSRVDVTENAVNFKDYAGYSIAGFPLVNIIRWARA